MTSNHSFIFHVFFGGLLPHEYVFRVLISILITRLPWPIVGRHAKHNFILRHLRHNIILMRIVVENTRCWLIFKPNLSVRVHLRPFLCFLLLVADYLIKFFVFEETALIESGSIFFLVLFVAVQNVVFQIVKFLVNLFLEGAL